MSEKPMSSARMRTMFGLSADWECAGAAIAKRARTIPVNRMVFIQPRGDGSGFPENKKARAFSPALFCVASVYFFSLSPLWRLHQMIHSWEVVHFSFVIAVSALMHAGSVSLASFDCGSSPPPPPYGTPPPPPLLFPFLLFLLSVPRIFSYFFMSSMIGSIDFELLISP